MVLQYKELNIHFQDGPLYVIVEYAEHGCLRDFLRGHANDINNCATGNEGYERPNSAKPQTITEKQLVSFARQVNFCCTPLSRLFIVVL